MRNLRDTGRGRSGNGSEARLTDRENAIGDPPPLEIHEDSGVTCINYDFESWVHYYETIRPFLQSLVTEFDRNRDESESVNPDWLVPSPLRLGSVALQVRWPQMSPVKSVNSLDLPPLLLELIEGNKWCLPDDQSIFDELFDHHSGVTFYSTSQMETETSSWLSLSVHGSNLRGAPDPENSPGDIEPSLTVLIGDIGMGLDSPFALDYRTSLLNPRIVHFRWHGPNEFSRWVEIAPDFHSFASMFNR